jgi:SdrD B-like protein
MKNILRAAAVLSLALVPAQLVAQKPARGGLLPGTHVGVLATIRGNALDSASGPLAETAVRLRDARSGHIVDTQTTDKAGLFEFHGVEPGSYIIEILAPDRTVLAASQMISVNAGDSASAVVKLPFRIPPFAGVLGHSAQSAAIVTAAAGASQILAVKALTSATPSSTSVR